MQKIRQMTFLQFFGYLALILGILIEGYALLNHPGSLSSGDDMFGGAVVLALAVSFLHDRPLGRKLVIIALSTLGFGYFTFIHTHAWLWTILLAIAIAAFLIYVVGIREDIHRSHSDWLHF
ncbi:hypothetical protein FD30_GL000404 [Levilactobacillus namurensis DSM 19117]|uniref:Integral membrane protein n=1 Tax=Levilactobacillus namurensis DSM 19117 TaxID=1423773 RepID=A0A0R1JQJ6_9LACO|nr:hypothetical protein [Levilactobacillus namurensis]KRK73566.1 hypothetical protein FD30_GL000404 [Levilactobacillus namurensis DSM 19117]GEO74983.1 hypothetical protein LNA02_16810 [Levilactobacillus namurensis]HJE45314.1 hypothetical protein [Levilactobacillus namurensis]